MPGIMYLGLLRYSLKPAMLTSIRNTKLGADIADIIIVFFVGEIAPLERGLISQCVIVRQVRRTSTCLTQASI